MKRIAVIAASIALGIAVSMAAWFGSTNRAPAESMVDVASITPALIERGAYLARAGDCAACHTARGGAAYAGGRGIETPFGTVYSSNLTPDATTGLGRWRAGQFWQALHHGRSADGRLLYPAFPYPNYTRVTRADADALFAFLQSLTPVSQPNRPHDLRFPYDSQFALATWRTLFFRPAEPQPDPARSADWNRGAYLVQGLGHCNACHASRNAFGATPGPFDLGGGIIPMQNWYAPSLASAHEAGVAGWTIEQVVEFLKTGATSNASSTATSTATWATALGPMGEVVRQSTQHLTDADLRAMATYLKALPQVDERVAEQAAAAAVTPDDRGRKLYAQHCAQCHGDHGEGVTGAYARLDGNRAVVMDPPANLVRMVIGGGFAPSTAGNPRPFGMPPFATTLSSEEISWVLSYIRTAWGNRGRPVSALDVERYRTGSSEP